MVPFQWPRFGDPFPMAVIRWITWGWSSNGPFLEMHWDGPLKALFQMCRPRLGKSIKVSVGLNLPNHISVVL